MSPKWLAHRAIPGGPPGQLCRAVEVGAFHQLLDALVDIAQALLEPDDRLAAGGEAEMSGLDDAGMDRTDRDLVQAFALGGKEDIRRGCAVPRRRRAAERVGQVPPTVVEPGAQVRRAFGLEPEQIADRALQPDRGRMHRADRGKPPGRTVEAQHAEIAGRFVEQRHMHGRPVAPEAEQGHAPVAKRIGGEAPSCRVDDGARIGPMRLDPSCHFHQLVQCCHGVCALSRGGSIHAGTTPPAAAAGRCRRRRRGPDAPGAAHRRP